MKQVDDVWF